VSIHIGKKIKEEVYWQSMPIITFAKKINRSRNVVYDIFERESVDTDLLNKIGKILNCDFFSMYSAQKDYAHEGVRSFYVREPDPNYNKFTQEFAQIQEQNQLLKNEIAYLKKIISLLEDKKGAKVTKKKPK
jgi:hypothetical protein